MTNDYVQQIEKRNEELQQKLAAAETLNAANALRLKFLEKIREISIDRRDSDDEAPTCLSNNGVYHIGHVTTEAYEDIKDVMMNKHKYPDVILIPRIIIYKNGEWELAFSSMKFGETHD
jgi:serine protease inhibitor